MKNLSHKINRFFFVQNMSENRETEVILYPTLEKLHCHILKINKNGIRTSFASVAFEIKRGVMLLYYWRQMLFFGDKYFL